MSRLFDRDVHKRHLTLLLIELAKTFPEKIAFKGGTCAYFFYNLSRFSFDLDFDMLLEFTAVDLDLFREIISKNGRARDFYNKKKTLFCLFDYGKDYPNIKIELNKRVWKYNVYKPVWFMGVPILIANESTVLTHKLVALTDRKIPVARDLYDIWYFLKSGFVINEALLIERTSKNTGAYLTETMAFIKKTYTARNILQGLGGTLDEKQKVWAKVYLISETLEAIKRRIA